MVAIRPGRAIAAICRASVDKYIFRAFTSQPHRLGAASKLPHSILQPVHRSSRAPTPVRSGFMSVSTSSLHPTKGVVGQSGSRYNVLETLQHRGRPWGSVYLATEYVFSAIMRESQSFTTSQLQRRKVVLKEIPQDRNVRTEIYRIAAGCPHVRLPIDAVPEKHMLVFEYLEKHLLDLAQENIPLTLVKRILYDTLRGIASLHARGISHNGRWLNCTTSLNDMTC